MKLDPIGTVRNAVTEAVDADWGGVVSEIHVEPRLADGLRGLSSFSHVVVVFHMHEASFRSETDLVRRPSGLSEMPLLGIFAQRARSRPNPIGIAAVKLLSVEGNVVRVQGLDAIDGTPVLDLKPYFPAFDRISDARVPEWVDRLMEGCF